MVIQVKTSKANQFTITANSQMHSKRLEPAHIWYICFFAVNDFVTLPLISSSQVLIYVPAEQQKSSLKVESSVDVNVLLKEDTAALCG